MRIAFAKHTLSFALVAALLGPAGALALPSSAALADTGGAAAATPTTTVPPTTTVSTQGGATPAAPFASKTLATWFGPGFYGHTTACGQTMSPTLIGVASRTLACGTLIQIGYHGRHLTVPVLDRGPYGHIGATWDLTAGTAHALKIQETVRITTKIVGSLPNTPTLGEAIEAGLPAEATTPTTAPTPTVADAATGGAAAS